MKLFSKKEVIESSGSSIARIAKMSTNELHSWFNTTLMGLGRAFDLWRYEDGPNEVQSFIDSLNEIWKEIDHRSHDQ